MKSDFTTPSLSESENYGRTKYIDAVKELIHKIETTPDGDIQKVAKLVSDATINERPVYLFGAGHSFILSIECFARAGGMGNIQAMIDGVWTSFPVPGARARSTASGLHFLYYRRL